MHLFRPRGIDMEAFLKLCADAFVGEPGIKEPFLSTSHGFNRLMVTGIQVQLIRVASSLDVTEVDFQGRRIKGVRQLYARSFWSKAITNMASLHHALLEKNIAKGLLKFVYLPTLT